MPWSSEPVLRPQCRLTSPDAAFGGVPGPDGAPEYVVCAGGLVLTCTSTVDTWSTVGAGSDGGMAAGGWVRTDPAVQVLDALTGRVVTTISVDWESPAMMPVDGGVVVAGVDAQG